MQWVIPKNIGLNPLFDIKWNAPKVVFYELSKKYFADFLYKYLKKNDDDE